MFVVLLATSENIMGVCTRWSIEKIIRTFKSMVLAIAITAFYNDQTQDRQRSVMDKALDIMDPTLQYLSKLGTKILNKIDASIPSRSTYRSRRRLAMRMNNQFRGSSPSRRRNGRARLLAMTVIAMEAEVPRNSYGNPIYSNETVYDTDSDEVGIDNRCSACISYKQSDFVGPMQTVRRKIKGFGGAKTYSVKIGKLKWTFADDRGVNHTFHIPNSYYVPDGQVRLLSPQHWAKSFRSRDRAKAGETTTHDKTVLFWNNTTLTIPLTKSTNVATLRLAPGYKEFDVYCQEANIDYEERLINPLLVESTVVSDDETEPIVHEKTQKRWRYFSRETGRPYVVPRYEGDEPQERTPTTVRFDLDGNNGTKPMTIEEEEEDRDDLKTNVAKLLRYHQRFGHISFAKLQVMARQNIIPSKYANCAVPECSACMYGKATRRKWRDKARNDYKGKPRPPEKPGEVVLVDQLVSFTPGFIAQVGSGALTKERYQYATIFVDQYSRYGYVYPQRTAGAKETMKAKRAFELHMKTFGIKVQAYHADNGIFRANEWLKDCQLNQQRVTFAGVNAHFANGIAERRIRALQDQARTMLIHANHRWPAAISANLWPYAVAFANQSMNDTPSMQDKERRSPLQIVSKSQVQLNVKHWMPFGCPVFKLDNALQSGRFINKWAVRSKVGIYLGRSPVHSQGVALVLNIETGRVSPQYHVRFDPGFHTVKQQEWKILWQKRAGLEVKDRLGKQKRLPNESRDTKRARTDPVPPLEGGHVPDRDVPDRDPDREQNDQPVSSDDQKQQVAEGQGQEPEDVSEPRNLLGLPRPVPPETPVQDTESPTHEVAADAMMTELNNSSRHQCDYEVFALQSMFPDYETDDVDQDNPLYVYKATADPDSMYLHEAKKEPDWKKFRSALMKEWISQRDNGNYEIVERKDLPEDTPILPSVWQMKRKRSKLTGDIKKYKARLNIDGSKMKHGRDFDQTYAPVASWNSIRLLLVLVALNNWYTKQIDYVSAFPQAPVEKDLYMSIPKDIDREQVKGMPIDADPKKYALKLKRNVYGQPQSGRVWNQYLTDKLVKKVGFTQSKVDECVFYKGNVIYVLYTDDSILAGPDEQEVNNVIDQIRRAKLDITIEGDLTDFLGVNIDRKEDGSIHLTQPQLIDQILKDVGMQDSRVKSKDIPASSSRLLSRHSNSEGFGNSFHYRSVIGRLNYLEKASRSDIAYITHQCARFSADPKVEHGEAIRWIARYLKGTRDKGTILRPDITRGLEVHVDADFSGNWDVREAKNDPDTARSRHGFIISYAGCPIVWKSQLQGEITLSSTESEYTGLSYALREAIPIMELLKEIRSRGFNVSCHTPMVHCKVFEDNSGALQMAKEPKFRPRTKHINVKLHHFRSYVNSGQISIHKIDTHDQNADYLTKALPVDQFVKLRKKVMGW